jgi:cell fate (sporulation/competence/biofilm development) regulator YlbF (YheA/YmcA/DUF963 family)
MSTETADGEASDVADVEALGRRLGEAIASLPVYEEFEAAKEAVEADPEAQERIAEFERKREEFVTARQLGNADQEDLRDLQATQQELHSLPVMADFLEAQDALQSRLEDVNVAISEPLAVDFGGEAGGCCQD